MLALAPTGFEEADAGSDLELAAYGAEELERELARVFGRVFAAPVEPGWEDAWRSFHRPVRAGGLWIGPPWVEPPAGEPAVVVDPGRAFGTGAHPTTRACVELLAGLPRGSLLDVGCGSGVLAVAAVRLGFAPVRAVDVDPVAVEATRATARRNGVRVQVRLGDLSRDPLPAADVVVANVDLRAVESLLARRPGPLAVVSGYLAHEAPSAPGWTRLRRLELSGWAADLLSREPGASGPTGPRSAGH
ncbi:MAG TPA: 50S ribosomal protein L11 methyltransferase [Gaiellaceae bacterium]|nr:50S ribosomal protein L11 methyltransferase [Gaiellaceae bacterium]